MLHYTTLHTYIHTCIHSYIHYIHAYMQFVCVYIYISRIHVCVCMYVWSYTYTHYIMYMCTSLCVHIQVHAMFSIFTSTYIPSMYIRIRSPGLGRRDFRSLRFQVSMLGLRGRLYHLGRFAVGANLLAAVLGKARSNREGLLGSGNGRFFCAKILRNSKAAKAPNQVKEMYQRPIRLKG